MIEQFPRSEQFIRDLSQATSVPAESIASILYLLLQPNVSDGVVTVEPYELSGSSFAFEGLVSVIPCLKTMTVSGRGTRRDQVDFSELMTWGMALGGEGLIKAIRANFDHERLRLGGGVRDLLHGRIQDMTLFAAMAFRTELDSGENAYDWLMAHLLLATVDCLHLDRFGNGSVAGQSREAFRVCRGLVEKRQGLLGLLPVNEPNRRKYLAKIQAAQLDSGSCRVDGLNPVYLAPIELFLRGALDSGLEGQPILRFQAPAKAMGSEGNEADQDYCAIDDSLENLDVTTSQVQRGAKNPLYPELDDECAERMEVLTARVPLSRQSQRNIRRAALEVKHVANALSLSNQMFPFVKNELTPHEVKVMLDRLQEDDPLGKHVEGVKLAVALMFWCGAMFETVCETSFVTKESELKGIPLRILLEQDGRLALLVRIPELLKVVHRPDKAYPVVSSLRLELPPLLEKLVRNFVKTMGRNAPCRLFSDSKPLRDAICRWIRPMNREGLLQLSLVRISNYLVRQLIYYPGCDLAGALIMTGRMHFLGRSRMHYTAFDQATLAEIHKKVCQLLARHGTVLVKDVVFETISPGPKSKMVGTPFRPRQDAIFSLVGEMKFLVRNLFANLNPSDYSGLRRFHEVYTAYTCLFVNFSTTYRAVCDPSFLRGQIDRGTGLGILQDKDDRQGYNTRLIWVWDECFQQLDNYREHAEKLFSMIAPFSPTLVKIIWEHGAEDRFSRFFALDEDNRANLMSPTSLEMTLEKYFDYVLPANSHRHYLRSGLLERGCSPEVVDAFLGHWARGEEPWSRFSGLSPILYREELKRCLVPILEDAGWSALEGLGGWRGK